MAELFTTRSLIHAIAGSTAGCCAITIFYPLNLIRTRHQLAETGKSKGVWTTLMEIVESEGVTALYGGLWGNIVCLGTSNFVYFYIYNGLRAVLLSRKRRLGEKQAISASLNLLVACIAGSFNVMLTNPLWVASMRLMTQGKQKKEQDDDSKAEYSGVLDAVSQIAKCEGVAALWNGATASLMLVSNPVFQFVVYDKIKHIMARMAEKRGIAIRGIEFFLMGALAKAVATVLTYPIQLSQSRLRNAKDTKYTSTLDCLQKTMAKDGFLGLFRGMEAKLWQTVLAAAFHFLAYEKIIQHIQKLLLQAANK